MPRDGIGTRRGFLVNETSTGVDKPQGGRSGGTALLALAFVVLWNSGFIGAEYGLPYVGPLTLG